MIDLPRTDILVLGAGLAGLRAALSAHRHAPEAHITIVCAGSGPTGSSFTNRNNCLGMQVCFDEQDRAALLAEALNLAKPGVIFPALVRIMAAESLARFEDLLRLGLKFRMAGHSWQRFPACFSPASRRACIFDDLGQAFREFEKQLRADNIRWLTGRQVVRLVQEAPGGPVHGAVLQAANTTDLYAVQATKCIIAVGGPAPLFRHHVAGRDNPGYSYALLHLAGAELANLPFLQLMWSTPSKSFFPLAALRPPATIDGEILPDHLGHLLPSRSTHCPSAYALADSAIDCYLAEKLLTKSHVAIIAGHSTSRIAPMVHAGNGGAVIDDHGRTTVPNLYACGECATGMHGANRLGGAMVLATQVFGHRAGWHAAETLKKNIAFSSILFSRLVNNLPTCVFQEVDERSFRRPKAHGLYMAINTKNAEFITMPTGKAHTVSTRPTRKRLQLLTWRLMAEQVNYLLSK